MIGTCILILDFLAENFRSDQSQFDLSTRRESNHIVFISMTWPWLAVFTESHQTIAAFLNSFILEE